MEEDRHDEFKERDDYDTDQSHHKVTTESGEIFFGSCAVKCHDEEHCAGSQKGDRDRFDLVDYEYRRKGDSVDDRVADKADDCRLERDFANLRRKPQYKDDFCDCENPEAHHFVAEEKETESRKFISDKN